MSAEFNAALARNITSYEPGDRRYYDAYCRDWELENIEDPWIDRCEDNDLVDCVLTDSEVDAKFELLNYMLANSGQVERGNAIAELAQMGPRGIQMLEEIMLRSEDFNDVYNAAFELYDSGYIYKSEKTCASLHNVSQKWGAVKKQCETAMDDLFLNLGCTTFGIDAYCDRLNMIGEYSLELFDTIDMIKNALEMADC